ncbi:GspS/AspS pilotin family protein [Vibrio atypicus]|uniref:GspS/AspS pilotin family protein n=1 Tax=Vibrio atypicus TaxID=558271 RepID=UPI001359102C|nr:GspS/AspS pilotin family protein [Vibrio atypicus]
MFNIAKPAAIALLIAVTAGCSSSAQKQKHLELLADNRAQLLSAELPLEVGALSIMRASAKGSVIEMMMVYNQDAQGAKPTTEVLKHSINTYCTNPAIKKNLDAGLSYRIKMRNSRGQLMADQLITLDTCEAN